MSFTAFLEVRIDQFTRALNQAQAKMDQFADSTGKRLAEIGENFDKVGKSLSIGLTAPLAALGIAALKSSGDVEALKNGLTALTGSAYEAGKQMARLTKLTDIPGLSLEALTKGTINLQTIGFTAAKAEQAMAGLGNAIALVGGGQQDFEGALYGLQQLANTDFPLGEDLNILKERLPQITPLLKEAFGTARTEELQKLKITSAQVIDTIITGLDKLPKAAVGLNGAFSQIMNSIKVSLATLGDVINKTFDVTGTIQNLKTALQEITARFVELDPKTQKFILLLAGVAAAIGPVLVGIGAILQLAPLVGTAFAVVTGPIGLTIAAVAAATVAIIRYWDDIVEYFTNGRGHAFWDSIKKSAMSISSSLKTIFDAISTFIKAIWDRIGSNVISTVQSAFGTILNIVSTVIANITNILNIFASLLKGDWRGVLNGFKKLFEDIFKGIVAIAAGAIKTLSSSLASFFNLIGANGIASGLENFSSYLDRFTNRSEKAAKATTLVADAMPSLGNKSTVVKGQLEGLSNSAKKLGDDIANLKLELQGALMSEWGRQLFDINNKYDDIVKKYGGNKDILGLAEQARSAELLRTKMGQIVEEIKPLSQNKGAINTSFDIAIPDISEGLIKRIELNKQLFKNYTASIVTPFIEARNAIENIMSQGIVSVVSNSMSALGEALATGGNILGAIGNSLVSSLGGLAKQIGEQLIAFGIAGIALQNMIKNPFLAIAAGAALIALGSIATASVNNTLKAGMGGYSGGYSANSNISGDYTQFRGALYNNERQTVDVRIKGNDLVGSLNINNNRNNRLS